MLNVVIQISRYILASLFSLAVALWPQFALAQGERDFVFTDDEGLLVLRFAGTEANGLNENQIEEIVNVQLSTMVHDRLRADADFEAESVDSKWAESMALSFEEQGLKSD